MSVISEKVRDAKDLTEITMPVPEWGVDLLLISPTVAERLAMINAYTVWTDDPDGPVATLDRTAMAPSLVIACAHDPATREQAFEDGDLAMLQAKNGAIVDRIAQKCYPLVGFGEEGATEAGKDDSSTTRNADTESGSPALSGAR